MNDATPGAAPAPDRLALPESLGAYLEASVVGFRGPVVATKFKGGQSNPTYRLDAASGRYVLRRKPPGALLASAHAVDREFRVLRALHGGDVPVAKPLHLCADDRVIGSMFYVMEFVDGRIFWDPALPDATPSERDAIYREIVRTLAAIGRVDVAGGDLRDYGRPGNYFARQTARWTEQYRASETEALPAMEQLIRDLPRRCPPDDGEVALVHGDYRIDNLIFAPDAPRIAAVVDWELSTLGHPFADLAYFCMALRLPKGPVISGLAGVDRAALGIPSEDAIVAQFVEARGAGRAPDDWPFYLAFNFFRLAAIAQGVRKRSLQGNASSDQADAAGAMTRHIAEMGAALL